MQFLCKINKKIPGKRKKGQAGKNTDREKSNFFTQFTGIKRQVTLAT